MVAVVGVISSNTATSLTYDLLDARIQQYSNEFNAFSGEVYGALSATAAIVANYVEPEFVASMADPRGDVMDIMTDALYSNKKLTGVWTVWEPNAFDGKDSGYVNAPYPDGAGRFVPYFFKDGDTLNIEPLASYDDPVEGEYYLGARNSGKPYATDPYPYMVGGREVYIYSIAMPIKKNNAVLGVVGMDIDLNEITNVMNSGHILEDGYLFTLSPSGIITTHSNWDLVMEPYKSTWIGNYGADIDSALKNGGRFSLSAYSDDKEEKIAFLGNTLKIGDIDRNWLICEVIPEKTVNASSVSLIWTIIAIGLLIVVVVGVTIFFIIRGALAKLPKLKAAAEAI
jgi:methyl-accepting chemotaxis protein